jgi:hypothetical protein
MVNSLLTIPRQQRTWPGLASSSSLVHANQRLDGRTLWRASVDASELRLEQPEIPVPD